MGVLPTPVGSFYPCWWCETRNMAAGTVGSHTPYMLAEHCESPWRYDSLNVWHTQVLISDGSVYKLWSTYSWGACLIWAPIDGFQMSSKCPTSGGQTHDQEAAVQWTFHLERESIFYLSVLMVRTWCSAYYILYFVHSCTKHRPQLLPSGSEATPHENHL